MSTLSDRSCRNGAASGRRAAALVTLLAALAQGCGDPTKNAIIAELGGEAPGVKEGPLHRPGQPCVVCHDGDTARNFAVAGTVFWAKGAIDPAPGIEVALIDKRGEMQSAFTNCAGNFFLRPEEITVAFPFWVSVGQGTAQISMDSPVNGDGSCASCHGLEESSASAGRVYLYQDPPGPAPKDCP